VCNNPPGPGVNCLALVETSAEEGIIRMTCNNPPDPGLNSRKGGGRVGKSVQGKI
jgi:hypothetical protein